MGRPMLARLLAGAMATAAIVTVSGCSGEQPAPTSAPVDTTTSMPTPAATFASDEEALAAGVAAVERLNEKSAELVQDPSIPVGDLEQVASDVYLQTMTDSVTKLREEKIQLKGSLSVEPEELVYRKVDEAGVEVQFYFCLDSSNFQKIDSQGKPTDASGGDKRDYMIGTVRGEDNESLKVSEVQLWSRDKDC